LTDCLKRPTKYDHLNNFKRDTGTPQSQAWLSLTNLIHKVYKAKQDTDVTEMEEKESRLINTNMKDNWRISGTMKGHVK
jgi:hypothetical protein